MRQALDAIERQRQESTNALYANGMIGGDDLANAVNSVNQSAHDQRIKVLRVFDVLSDEYEEEVQFSMEPPMPTEVTDGG